MWYWHINQKSSLRLQVAGVEANEVYHQIEFILYGPDVRLDNYENEQGDDVFHVEQFYVHSELTLVARRLLKYCCFQARVHYLAVLYLFPRALGSHYLLQLLPRFFVALRCFLYMKSWVRKLKMRLALSARDHRAWKSTVFLRVQFI